MDPGRRFLAYTTQILAFRLGEPPEPEAVPPPTDPQRLAGRVLTAWRRSALPRLLILGCGSGRLLSALAEKIPPGAPAAVSEPEPERLRRLLAAGELPPPAPDGALAYLADTSPPAHLCLWRQAGFSPETTLALPNPELSPRAKAHLAPLSRLWPAPTHPLPAATSGRGPTLCAAAMLHPGEPDLAGFLAQFPPLVEEIVCLWDGEPPTGLPPDPRRRDISRSLAGDFGAQRTALLAACRADWVLMLDADERLPETAWPLLPALLGPGAPAGYLLPRLTLYPDAAHALVGYGLWPDVQLRLFARRPGLAFAGKIHERLTGLTGLTGALDIVPGLPILHRQRLTKSPGQLRDKLALFDAAGGCVRHVLSADYPRLPLSFFPAASAGREAPALIRLPGPDGGESAAMAPDLDLMPPND